MKKLARVAALSVMAISLTTGVAAANSGTIRTTGPDSYNKIESNRDTSLRVRNRNNVNVLNANAQKAKSGDARASHNTTAGGARSGDAMNDNLTETSVRLNNSGSSAAAFEGLGGSGSHTATIRNTGPDSYNKVSTNDSTEVSVKNTNNVNVVNFSAQAAKSGDASVYDNTTGGSARSGNASNVNTTSTTVNVTN